MTPSLPPYRTFLASDSRIRDLLRTHRSIAFCGEFADDSEAVRDVARQLKQWGYRIVPVTARAPEALGVKACPSLEAVSEPIGIALVLPGVVDRKSLVRQAAARGVEAVWFEVGAADPEAAHLAFQLGLTAVLGRSIVREYEMHFPDDELLGDE